MFTGLVETVGELVKLAPFETAELSESWELFAGVPPVATEADADKILLPLIR